MAVPQIMDPRAVMPTASDFEKILKAKLSYEAKQNTPERDSWNKKHFYNTPWGIAYSVSKAKHDKSAAFAKSKGKQVTSPPKNDIALKYLIIAIAIDWQDLINQLKRTLKNWGYTSKDLQNIAKNVWLDPINAQAIAAACDSVTITELTEQLNIEKLTEAIEKHESLNNKLFTKEELLKDRVRDKLLEIVDEFLINLKEQDIKIKVDDILLIGSNASYNYTKDSDIDLHILANTKAVKYDTDIANALYSAYRTLFNKQLDIKLFDIPLEIFVEIEDSPRVSNGVYSVKKNKWIKKPVKEAIPEYDKKILKKLVDEWETKCKDLIAEIKADKLDNEIKVVKLLEDIYEKLRKKGVAKSEYSEENLAFKELRNKGYLDQLKQSKNELISKRLSLEERLDLKKRADIHTQLVQIVGVQPIIQDNGMFFIYNLKPSEVNKCIQALRKLPFINEVQAHENGKYDFSQMAMTNLPTKYYDIRGSIKE